MDQKQIDLHTHSTASDGSCSPSEILDIAAEKELSVVALTDHDTVSGVEEFMTYSKTLPDVTAVPGVEISSMLSGKEIHIVGLFVNHKSEDLLNFLTEIRSNRDKRNLQIIEKLQQMGYEITMEEVIKASGGGESIGRPHFAKVLIDKGHFSKTQDVFDHCLRRGTKAYTPRILPSAQKAIEEIHKAGGIAIWAHPVHSWAKKSRPYVKKILLELQQIGLDGVEIHYTTYTSTQEKMLFDVAQELNLAMSGGSDFHGEFQKRIELGSGFGDLKIPEDVYHKLYQFFEYKMN